MSDESLAFREALRSELVASQQTRAAIVREKLLFVISALGLGVISSEWRSEPAILFLVPVVATLFDLYVSGEDFGIKRIGAFLGRRVRAQDEEANWQQFVRENRDYFSQIANPASSMFGLLGAAGVLWPKRESYPGFWIWLVGFSLAILAVWTTSHFRNRHVRRVADKPMTVDDRATRVRQGWGSAGG
jgi:hypothetical protein